MIASDEVKNFCVVCTKQVPYDRVKHKAITCTAECARTRKNAIRAKQEARECKYCRKPSTPEKREAFRRFTQLEAKRPDLLYPEMFKKFDLTRSAALTDAQVIDEFAKHFLASQNRKRRGRPSKDDSANEQGVER